MINPAPGRSIALQAYSGLAIPNWIDADPTPGLIELARRSHKSLISMLKQVGQPTGRYNCFGLVFASRRTHVPGVAPSHGLIDSILRADGLSKVAEERVQEGDIAVWRSGDDVDHAGIVCGVQRGPLLAIQVWSMWGGLGEFVHPVMATPYSGCTLEYWRLM